MPYTMTEIDGYEVRGPSGIHAKRTTKKKAAAQMRLLQGIEHGMKPRKKKRSKKRSRSIIS